MSRPRKGGYGVCVSGWCAIGILCGMLASVFKPRQEMVMKHKVVFVMLLSIAALSAGCNTVAGAGKDIQRGGEKIEGAAK